MCFLHRLIDDQERHVNPAHVIALSLTASSIVWITYLVFKNHQMPDVTGVAYLLGGSGAMNVAHKAEDIISRFKKNIPPETPVESVIVKKKEEIPDA